LGTAVLPVAIRRQLDDRCYVPLVGHRLEQAENSQTSTALPVFPYLHRHPDLLVASSEAQLFRVQRSGPWVSPMNFGIAALVRYLLSPQIAILLFVWMIAYHVATSEGLHANRIARLFTRDRLRPRVRARARGSSPRVP
jgi:hypothetical protein